MTEQKCKNKEEVLGSMTNSGSQADFEDCTIRQVTRAEAIEDYRVKGSMLELSGAGLRVPAAAATSGSVVLV